MRRIVQLVCTILIIFSLFGCKAQNEEQKQQQEQNEREVITSLVEGFGQKLQMVSLLAPTDIVDKSMKENYGEYVSPVLLEKWIKNPEQAPGRLTSSPWPDRIKIEVINKISDNEYKIEGKIIEITSADDADNGIAISRPITLTIKKSKDKWLIDNAILGEYDKVNPIVYKNKQYGFEFVLPIGWKRFMISTDIWKGIFSEQSQNNIAIESGPIIYIRHPQWTFEKPYQDIPIMIFTENQWRLLQNEKFHIGEDPASPSELGRNSKYVFALPAHYNSEFITGYQEVENILNSNPLEPNENINME